MTFIDIKNLTKKYILSNGNIIQAIRNINLEIKKGEIFGIFGRSGAGKTTLIRILRGVEPFDEGIIKINGISLLPNNNTDKQIIHKLKRFSSIHLQRSFGLWADTVLHNIMRRLNVIKYNSEVVDLPNLDSLEYNTMKNETMKILEIVGLDQKADWFSGILSGGEKQRLVLARQLALAGHGLQLLLLDEPLTMSDSNLKFIAFKELKEIILKNEITAIITSHLPKILEYLCDRIAILEKGIIKKIILKNSVNNKITLELPQPIKLKPLSTKKIIISIEDLDIIYYRDNLKKAFNLKIKELNIYKGEILGILGRSGIGKTILLRTIAGLEIPKKGKIIFYNNKNVNIYKLGLDAMEIRRTIGLMHQELDLEYYAYVKDLILSKLGLKGETAIHNALKKAKELGIKENIIDVISRLGDLPYYEISSKLEKLELDPHIIQDLFPVPPFDAYEKIIIPMFNKLDLNINLLERKTSELSGGEKIRIALLLQLFSKPKILLLDEPFGDLDPYNIIRLINFLKEINSKSGLTIIIASHHSKIFKECVHRIVKLKEMENFSSIENIFEGKSEIKSICDDFSPDLDG
ncbi:MAG: ATP-binding cassette domain-containing protein [Candidatus Helarchaeota archaeon]